MLNDKMKIMILSPYDNAELRSHLEFKEYNRYVNFFIKKLGIEEKTSSFKDVAPWVGNLIAELEARPDVEIVSVAPHIKLRRKIESFKLGRTTYYYYSSDYSSVLRLIKNYRLWKVFQNCGRLVRRIADEVKPDVIILFGTENPIISVPILKLTNYPVFCILQTVYNNPDRAKYSNPSKFKQQLELDILRHVSNYGAGKTHGDLIHKINPHVNVLKYSWPTMRFSDISEPEKRFDFVNFAFSMDSRKGDEDSIRALAIVKKTFPDVTLNITGGYSPDRKKYLEKIIDELELNENISFTPFFENHDDMLRHVMQSRFAVLPIKLDLVSTTVKEAMFYKMPVVTNATKGTPSLNKEKTRVLLAEIENIDSLAEKMLQVMQNPNLAELLKKNAHEYIVQQQENNAKKVDDLMHVLNAIYDNKHYQTPIPKNLFL